MSGIEQNKLDKDIRDGIELLGEISESWVLSAEDKSRVIILRDEYLNRINSMKLHLGIIGEFNAGKSTLLNSLLGKNIVATSSRPCTPVPIYIQGSEIEQLKVNFTDSTSRLVPLSEYAVYTTEGEGPQGVKDLEMAVNSPLLKDNNITLIDTPGINSINSKHTEVTLSSLKDMHAAILLIYSKQPGSKSTIEFLQQAASHIDKIFICISKSDFLSQDQLERVVRDLPGRLSKSSGLQIDKVWPIHIADDGAGQDMELFLQEIQAFMIGEWYKIISKDLSKTLVEYSLKASDLLSDRLSLHEKIFFEYMQSNPTDFSLVASMLRTAVAERIDRDFPIGQFEKPVSNEARLCYEKIRAQLLTDINPNGKLFGIFDKRTTKQEAQQAYDNSVSIFNRLLEHEYSIRNKLTRYSADIEKLAMTQLSHIHSTLQNFDSIVFEKLQNDHDVIRRAKMIRFKRWLIVPGLALVGIILNFTIFSAVSTFSVLASFFFIMLLLLIPLCFYYYPSKTDICRLSNQRLQRMKRHVIPRFSLELDIFKGWNTQNDFIRKDLYLGAHLLKRIVSVSSVVAIIGFLATFAFYIFFNGMYIYDDANNIDISFFVIIGSLGVVIGLALFVIIFVLAYANSVFTYMRKPKAKYIYSELVAKWEFNINLYQKELLKHYTNLRERIMVLSDRYICSLPEKYSLVMDDAFKANIDLSRKLENKMDFLKNFIVRLNVLNSEITAHTGGIRFSCPHCGQHLEADLDMAGITYECPSCKRQIQIPMSRKRDAAFA